MAKENLDNPERETGTDDSALLNNEEVFALIDKICFAKDKRNPGEVTAQEVAVRRGKECSVAAAAMRMNRAVERGEMTKRKSIIDGHSVTLYSIVVKTPISITGTKK